MVRWVVCDDEGVVGGEVCGVWVVIDGVCVLVS